MSSGHSVSHWIASLKAGELKAAQKIWERYSCQLIKLAQRKLRSYPRRAADEEDVAQSVFLSLCRGAAAGRFTDVTTRDELWWLLLALTKQKVVNFVRRETAEKRGAGRVRSESSLTADAHRPTAFTLDHFVAEIPTPEFLVTLADQNQRLMRLLRDDQLRRIAAARIEGYTVGEIAAEMNVSTRCVERKLQLIRTAWFKELNRGDRKSHTA